MEGNAGSIAALSATDLQAVVAARDNLRITALIDTNKRGLPGVFIFVSLWPTIGFLTDLHRTHPAFVYVALGIFVGLGAIRIAFYRRVRDVIRHSFTLARFVTVGLILAGALAWGVIAAATIHFP